MSRTIDLIPEDYRSRRWRRARMIRWVLAGCAVILLVIIAGSRVRAGLGSRQLDIDALRRDVESMKPWQDRLPDVAARLKDARARQIVVNRLLNEPDWSGLLADVSAATGENLWLTRVSFSKSARETVVVAQPAPAVQAPDEVPEETVMMISGLAYSNFHLLRFMNRLSQSAHVAELDLEVSKALAQPDREGMVEFDVRGVLK